jgi:hypothetical protein
LATFLSDDADGVMRLCTSWRTTEVEIRALLEAVDHADEIGAACPISPESVA